MRWRRVSALIRCSSCFTFLACDGRPELGHYGEPQVLSRGEEEAQRCARGADGHVHDLLGGR
jgi:hypothetical protein